MNGEMPLAKEEGGIDRLTGVRRGDKTQKGVYASKACPVPMS